MFVSIINFTPSNPAAPKMYVKAFWDLLHIQYLHIIDFYNYVNHVYFEIIQSINIINFYAKKYINIIIEKIAILREILNAIKDAKIAFQHDFVTLEDFYHSVVKKVIADKTLKLEQKIRIILNHIMAYLYAEYCEAKFHLQEVIEEITYSNFSLSVSNIFVLT
jgi:hypothetical protein